MTSSTDPNDLITQLINTEGLHALLSEKTVKANLITELRDLSIPAPGLVYRAILFAAGGCEQFLLGSLSSRLQAMLDKSPKISGVIQKILNLKHGAKTKDALKTELIKAIREDRPAVINMPADEATSLEMAISIHQAKSLEEIKSNIANLDSDLQKLITTGFRDLEHNLVRPVLKWPDPSLFPDKLSAFDRLKYTSGLDDFVGRQEDIDLLHHFAGDPSLGGKIFNFQWMLMTAEGGSGKTRLAYHFTKNELNDQWEKGKLSFDALARFTDPNKWRPNRPTFIVIDYAQNVPEQIHRLLCAFSQNAAQYEFPVRLLLLERHSDPSWTDKMLRSTSDDSPQIMDRSFRDLGANGHEISPLIKDDIITLMKARFEKQGLTAPDDADLIKAAHAIDPRHRPLFALAVTDTMIDALKNDQELPKAFNREEVMEQIIHRDRVNIWENAVPDRPERKKYERGLALATLTQGLDLSQISSEHFGTASTYLPPSPPMTTRKNYANLAASGIIGPHLNLTSLANISSPPPFSPLKTQIFATNYCWAP